jgi:hypothetical protein
MLYDLLPEFVQLGIIMISFPRAVMNFLPNILYPREK